MKKEFPVYDICKFSYAQEQDVIIKSLAPYLKAMRKLHFPHRHDFYHIILFTSGAGTHAIDFETFTIAPFHVYFMAPGQVHGWDFEGEVDGYVINFSADFFKSFLYDSQYLEQFPFFSGNVHYSETEISQADHSTAIEIMEKAVLEAEGQGRFKVDLLRVLLLQFFILIAKSDRYSLALDNKGNRNNTVLRNFEKLIEQNYKHQRLPKFYAELLCITPSHLNAICKEFLGASAGDIIRNRIVLEAKRMLINLDFTVTEIAYNLNFEDNSYFCKFFKNQAGVSPETFRRRI
ncbi:AraC family transcriptional regulator [Mucilaginibacter dorajii]|uniref:Helix-turn-helix transcriptional regulator n=1 Tax=Mucilaginibacter dorajii TaxID=692994 RepID=A0ABP7PQS0_9SPHI|nr:AraC family transcriptional regulator [Mucilaginibacter dorajii]MCS3737586.1 AraC-like DNA-binding protein [Mucilaginibacter dorajii]